MLVPADLRMVFAGLLASRTDRRASRGSSASSSGSRPKLSTPRSSSNSGVSILSGHSSAASAGSLPACTPAADHDHREAHGHHRNDHHHAHKRQHSNHGHEYIFDESQLTPVPEEAPDLRELNNSLEALATLFPDVQIDVFREMLSSFDDESRLFVVADALLKNRASWVKGRWRIATGATDADVREAQKAGSDKDKDNTSRQNRRSIEGAATVDGAVGNASLPRNECFRSPEYKNAVQKLAFHEFKGLSRSAINAVLAEQNYSYLEARQTLVGMSQRSWRYTMTHLFRRKTSASASATPSSAACGTDAAAENHPLVVWKSSGRGSILPTVRTTGNAELDRELYDALVAPLQRRARTAQEERDRVLAVVLNTEEAEEAEATHECTCCFAAATFEEVTTCGAEGHIICFRCVQHSVSEAVFGQGWQRSIDPALGTLRCPAVTSLGGGGGADQCHGCVPVDQMHRAMLEEKNGAEVLHRLDQRLAEHGLITSGLPLVRCPFCSYAEVDDLYLARHESDLRLRADSVFNLIFLLICVGLIPFLMPAVLLSSFACLLFTSHATLGDRLVAESRAALTRHRRRRRGARFVCQEPRCGRASCLSCGKAWVDVHVCHESALLALRTQVEQAMSMAIKRVCPRCNTSFVKTAGCNKLTCPCGYKMCYVCRKDIGDGTAAGDDVGYRHFCDHFRPEGDPRPCDQCTRCNLWETEDTEAVLRAAKDEAERKWLEAEGRGLNGAEKAFIESAGGAGNAPSTVGVISVGAGRGTGKGAHGTRRRRTGGSRSVGALFLGGRWPSLPEVCDTVVETIFV